MGRCLGQQAPYIAHLGRSGEWPPEQCEYMCSTGEPDPDGCPHNLKGFAPWLREHAGVQDGRAHRKARYCPPICFSSPVAWQPSAASFLSWYKPGGSSLLPASNCSSHLRGSRSQEVTVHLAELRGKQVPAGMGWATMWAGEEIYPDYWRDTLLSTGCSRPC